MQFKEKNSINEITTLGGYKGDHQRIVNRFVVVNLYIDRSGIQ